MILALLFAIVGGLLLLKGTMGQYTVAGFGLLAALAFGEKKHNRILLELYGKRSATIRVIENTIVVVPFVLLLLVGQSWMLAGALIVMAPLVSLIPPWGGSGIVLRTPFSRWPFEFPSGYRLVFPLFIGTYLVCGIGLWVGNFNLSAFTVGVNYLICLQFYSKNEPAFYLWIYDATPLKFLKKKVISAIICSTIIAAIPAFAVVSFYPENWWVILLIIALGPLYLVATILAKYAYYPSEVNIVAALGIGASIFIPPLLLVVIPIFFAKSADNLSRYLV